MSSGTRLNGLGAMEHDIEKLREEVCKRPAKLVQRAKGASVPDIIALAMFAPLVHVNSRRDVFAVFLKFLRDAETQFKKTGVRQREYAPIVIKVLSGVGQSEAYIKEDRQIAEALARDWTTVARWIRRFCDNFKSSLDPFPGAFIPYGEWYQTIMITLILANAVVDLAPQMWSVFDARYALYKLWLLEGPSDLRVRVVPICSGVLAVLLLHDQFSEAGVGELIECTGAGVEALAHLAMTRLINASKNGVVDDTRDYAYMVLALMSSPNDSLRLALLRKKAITFLTKIIVKIADPETIQQDDMHPNFVTNYLVYFERITDPEGGFPYKLQALRHGLLRAIVQCGSLLDKLDINAVEALKHIIGKIMIKYLVYYSFLNGVLNAMRENSHDFVKKCIDGSALESCWTKFEQYLLERTANKAIFDQSTASDLSQATCGNLDCKKRGFNNEFRKCAGCENAFYCSKECQAEHWKHGGHRAVCKSTPEDLRGWSRRDQTFMDFVVMCDAFRHTKGLHQLAVQRYGFDPIRRLNTQPYGCSVDYCTIPPTLDVFRLEDDPDTTIFLKPNEILRGVAEQSGTETYILKTYFPQSSTQSMVKLSQGNLAKPNEHVWEEEYDAAEAFRGLRLRPSGVDEDGEPLRVIQDEFDILLDRLLPSKVKAGVHFRWDACNERGKANVVEEINQLGASLLNEHGKHMMKPNNGGSAKGPKK